MKRYVFQDRVYDSKSEVGIATLLGHYVPGFQSIEGQTLHAFGDTETNFYFILSSAIIEWRPKRNRDAWISMEYRERRANINDFYNKLLLRFGKNAPSLRIVKHQFSKFVSKAKWFLKGDIKKFLSPEDFDPW